MSRQKKYKMKAIPSAISEKGGYTAQFVGDGYSMDASFTFDPSAGATVTLVFEDGAELAHSAAKLITLFTR